ncbi:MAG: PD-(D/E)XK nuclease family protein, partial [Sedimentisphaerales bacterium]|nr:PD-(D/E)XK nuclease family protein [Sedimentisphaerales bacterium]
DRPDGKAEFNVVDPHSGQKRPVQYRDIVVLLRSMKMRAEPWSEVFGRMGIPVHAELSRGYFVATEIQDMICLLQLLDNPRRDIALASVLRSELVALNESQLAAIRLHCPDGSFYNAINRYIEDGPDESLKDSLAGFFQRLDRWRDLARRGNLAELIWHIYRETDLLAYVTGLPDGRQRHRNLLYLHDCARRFGSFARQGLARFLRFIDKLREEEGDFGPAPILSEADNVVRIMSVHKSKGLEFPVVIVADLARGFNLRDTRCSILFESFPDLSESCSVGLRIVDSVSRDNWPTIAHNVIADELKQRRLAEEMRILYVAFTRSRERLLLVASVDLDQRRKKWQSWHNERGQLPEFLLRSALRPIDWLGPALAAHPDMRCFFQQEDHSAESAPPDEVSARFALTTYPAEQVSEIIQEAALFSDRPKPPVSLDELISCDTSVQTVPADPQVTKIINRLNWRYPHETLSRLRARSRVTDLKHLIDLDGDPEFTPDLTPSVIASTVDIAHAQKPVGREKPRAVTITEPFKKRPTFLADQPLSPTAAEVGSWTHLLLEKLDFTVSLDESGLAGQLREIVGRGFLTQKQADYIDLSAVARLFISELGQKMLAHCDGLYREWPFTLAVPVGEIYRDEAKRSQQPFSSLSAADKNEPVLVRGVIDCLFETDSGWVIVDYKTDRIAPDPCDERAAFYGGQMLLYR